MIDPRREAVIERISRIPHVIPVLSSKGGVGKSLTSTGIAVLLSQMGRKVGLLDLDFWGASDHIILGVSVDEFPEEDRGILPVPKCGLKFMSVAFYTRNQPLPMRGSEYTDALLELMAVTRWDDVEYLVIDMPPGLGDPFLNLISFFRKGHYVVVTTPSPLSVMALKNTIHMLKEQKIDIVGVVENMSSQKSLKEFLDEQGLRHLGNIPMINDIDAHMGDCEKFASSEFIKHLRRPVERIAELIG